MDFAHQQSIFQSKLFADFQRKVPYRGKTFMINVSDDQSIIHASVIRVAIKERWSWLWIPYGPEIKGTMVTANLAQKFFAHLKIIAKEENALFTSVEPGLFAPSNLLDTLRDAKQYDQFIRYTPDHTLILDLRKNNELLLKEMKPKGRYNIKVAEKNGVEVRTYSTIAEIPDKDFDQWYKLIRETGERDGFGTHEKKYYSLLLDTLGMHHNAALFLAYAKTGEIIGGSIMTFYDHVGMYYYGASSYTYRSLMAPYAIQWAAIREAKKRGCIYYDFLGVSPPGASNHAWHGVTDFKEKFGGERIHYPSSFTIVHRPILAWMYRMIKG